MLPRNNNDVNGSLNGLPKKVQAKHPATPDAQPRGAASSALPKLAIDDPYLAPYAEAIRGRISRHAHAHADIAARFGSLAAFAAWHKEMGLFIDGDSLVYREWAPAASALHLVGDFNGWNPRSHPLARGEGGVWELRLPAAAIAPGSELKVRVTSASGETLDRLPAFTVRTSQHPQTYNFNAVLHVPDTAGNPAPFAWSDADFAFEAENLFIYECHTGMAGEEPRVASFEDFTRSVLPRIARAGYTCIQLMAVMEHPYYGSFGYHVSNIFAVSSRFGSPDDFKRLVDAAHGLGIAVVMDVVHSHAVKNLNEGLAYFDGSDAQYFRRGAAGYHALWDSMIYDYGKPEVRRYLLSNLRFWMEEYHVDGFRFDGVTSMLYAHHGFNTAFTHYDMYFSDAVDDDALLYLQLACDLAHEINPRALCIAEDMSGMPGLCRPAEEGGLGFDYRLAMGIPDYWIKTIKEKKDEEWNLPELYHQLINRRANEKSIAYVESHDQAIVGDKTIAFRLMDQAMYDGMSVESNSPIIDRGIALHKLLRLITLGFGGEAYLSFMGNEFGHPEWIDFPREGNGFSYHYARRQWSLADNPDLRYGQLARFDRAMLDMAREARLFASRDCAPICIDEKNGVLVARRGELIFAFCFNPTESFPAYAFGVPHAGAYRIVLSSDDAEFGGFGRIARDMDYNTAAQSMHGHEQCLRAYLCSRTAVVFRRTHHA